MKRVTALGATLALLLAPALVRLLKAQSPSASPPPPPTYTLTDLGPMTVGGIDQLNVRTGPTALNANAQVAGFRFNLAFGDQPIGFLWDKGTFTDLGTGGGPQSYAYGINDAGQIVGASNFVASSNFTGDLTGNSSRAFLWQNGVMTILDPDPNNWSRAYAINKGGDAAGFISPGGVLPVIWKAGAGRTMLTSLPCSLAACQGEALAINDLGQAAGVSVGGNVNAFRPVMWDANGQPTDILPTTVDPGCYTEANGINNSGVVIGYYQPQVLCNTPIHAFSWQSATLTDLGAVGTDTYSGAWGINSKGDIVGISGTTFGPILGGPNSGGHAFLYLAATQKIYDLTSLLAQGTNWTLDTAFAINDNGQIVGTGRAPDLTEHGYLLTPVVTPTTTAVSTSGTPSVFGQSVSFTATVTPAPPNSNAVNDTVTFTDGNTTLGSGTYNGNGMWIFNTTAPLSVANHSITASYGGDNNFGPSTSTTVTQTVGQAGTVTGLVASQNTVNVGQAVTFTATVTVAAPGAGTPTGAVTFSANGAPLTCTGGGQTVSAGQATCQYAFGTAGAESITASYGGDTSFTGSTGASGITVTTQGPPPVQIMDNETIQVTDTESFSDVYDAEAVHVADAVFVTPLIQASAPVAEFSAGALGFSGQSGSQTITVSDIGTASLTLASATISGSSQFTITQIACSSGATSAPTTLPSGGACVLTIGYSASATPANDNATLTFTDNAALSNLASTPASLSYTQSIPLNGSGTTTAPPPPPLAAVSVMDNETIHVTDTASFSDIYDAEAVHVADAVFVTPLIQASAPVAEFSAGTLGFSGQSGSQTITLSDIGTASLALASATISGSSQFTITQIACSNSATSFSTMLPSGGACVLTIGYSASSTPANDNATLTFTDNAALSNLASVPSGSSYMQSIALSGSGTSTPPPPPPPAVIPVTDNETIHVMDTESFQDVFDAEAITVTDQVAIQIISIPTSTSITAPQAPYGTASTTVSVSASSGTVSGIVTLSVDGGSPLTMNLSGGSATFSLTTFNAGVHSLSASFAAQGAFAASSALAKLTIDRASPTVSFTGAPSSAPYQSTFSVATATNATTTATITASGACSISGTTVTMTSGTGTCNLTANWPADTNYLAATATQTTAAAKIAPAVSFTGAPATAPYNSTFAVTAATNASTAATITASGVCSITGTNVTMTSGTGTCTLLAQWPADTNYLAATAKQSTTATLALSKTAITASSPNPSLVGQAVAVKFIVTGNGLPTGTVTISDGIGDSCKATVASGGCSVSITTAGAKTLTAVYGGDTNFAGSTSAGVSQTVNKGNTTIKITAHSPSSSVAGQPVKISFVVAVVAPASGAVSGSVKVSDSVGDTCTAPVSTGTCSMIFAAAGTKTVTASYGGDNNFNPSTSSAVTQTVTDFSISAKPSSQIIKAGQKAGYNTTLAPLNGFVGAVSVSCAGAPPGATCTVSPNSAMLNGSMAMTLGISVQTSRSTPAGNYTLTLKGIFTSGAPATGGLTHAATVTLTVQ